MKVAQQSLAFMLATGMLLRYSVVVLDIERHCKIMLAECLLSHLKKITG